LETNDLFPEINILRSLSWKLDRASVKADFPNIVG
jgi:hypothetical protein